MTKSTSQRSLRVEGITELDLVEDRRSQFVYIPFETKDYIVNRGSKGLELLANRDISEGEFIFSNSLQFVVSDVENLDHFLLKASRLPAENVNTIANAKETFNVVPAIVPLEKEMLFTHGIPVLTEDPSGISSGIISHYLQIPGCLLNHSCDPNVIQDGGHDGHERHLALRSIKKGEELNIDYSLIYFTEGPISQKCLCGSINCAKRILGFKDLEIDKQDRLLPLVSNAVRAMYLAEQNVGKSLLYEQPLVSERVVQAPKFTLKQELRLVYPSPSSCKADIAVHMGEDNVHRLHALRDFREGEIVYKYWIDDWPMKGKIPIEMVFPTAMGAGTDGIILR